MQLLFRALIVFVMLVTSAVAYRIGWRSGAIEGQVYACQQFVSTGFPPQARAHCIVEDSAVHVQIDAMGGQKFFLNGRPVPMIY